MPSQKHTVEQTSNPREPSYPQPHLTNPPKRESRRCRVLPAAAPILLDPRSLPGVRLRRSRMRRRCIVSRGRWRRGCRRCVSSLSTSTTGMTPVGGRRPHRRGKVRLRQISKLPGLGEQKAKIFVALFGKQLGVTPPGCDLVQCSSGGTGHRTGTVRVDAGFRCGWRIILGLPAAVFWC